ncbi:Transcription initiation factor TFIID subunit 9B-like [Oopsacas minuta]|uniref:Transcription initiation factor TFIID subunit 9B-like n=1 Tax=Oopsacas minuta TaxID=111878 RepID=A0AAV7KCC0_9METZ|nr:Transcription initiation factor TFIID subunit 9B-like [Oopsacas minuta]
MSSNSHEPRDMSVMRSILKEMGVTDYEPAVLHQLMEFTYKYITGVLEDAKVYSEHASKDEIDLRDVKLALEMRLNHCYTLPPPREFLLEIARDKNSTPMPLINERFGIRLPPDRFCLTATNLQLVKKDRPAQKELPNKEIKIPQSMPTLDTITQSAVINEPTHSFAPFESTQNMSMKALKRKHDEDYDEF